METVTNVTDLGVYQSSNIYANVGLSTQFDNRSLVQGTMSLPLLT